jgi:23S rRNA pseudouridine1911/1915/1917 synthase
VILFENDSLIAVNKTRYIRVQAGRSGGSSLEEETAALLAARQAVSGAAAERKPFLGLVHRIDQPVTGVVVFAKTPRALARLNAAFQQREVTKIYWAVVDTPPPAEEGCLEHYLTFDLKQNKARVFSKPLKGGKKAQLRYRLVGKSERYVFLEIRLLSGRPHQIRAQLAAAGCHIKGDLKYGAARSNPGGGIHLHARHLAFHDPETGQLIEINSPPPEDTLWALFPG